MAPVPWVTTSPDLIEQIVAVLLSRRHPEALRVRASQGDRGLDVLVRASKPGYVDNYQVKRFATGLMDSQKAQIRNSLKSARDLHNDPSNPFLIQTWLLTLPLDPSDKEIAWLAKAAAKIGVPFDVEWRPLPFLEGLVTEFPEVIDYYLRDGKERLQSTIADVRSLADLSVSQTGAPLEPGDLTERLGTLLQALNKHDPHYRYDFEVTAEYPILYERPNLVASVVDEGPGGYVTFHIYAKYVLAIEDRPIPITFAVSGTDLTPEASAAMEAMTRYGTPVDLPAAAVRDLNIDMPGGLGITAAPGGIRMGPARGEADKPSRVVWAIVPPDDLQPIAQLTFAMEAPTRGALGGMYVRGTDTTGVVAGGISVDPADDEHAAIRLSVNIIDPQGKPVRQVLPGLHFLRQFRAPNRLAFGPEYGLLTPADSLPLPDSPQAIPAIVLDYAGALDIISQRSNSLLTVPDFSALAIEDYATVIGTANILRGEPALGTFESIPMPRRPGEIDPSLAQAPGPRATTQPLTVVIAGVEYDLGSAHTYLPSARVEGDLNAEPGPDGTIELMLVPGESNYAVRSLRLLSRQDVQAVIDAQSQPVPPETTSAQPEAEPGPAAGPTQPS